MPELLDNLTMVIRNGSAGSSPAILPVCSEWERAQSGWFQAANLLWLAAFLIPHSSFRWSIFLSRMLMGLAFALVALWAALDLCAPDVFLWALLLTATSSVHIAYWSCFLLPIRIRHPLVELYQKLFLPLDVSRKAFTQLTLGASIASLQVGSDYFAQQQQQVQLQQQSLNSNTLAQQQQHLAEKGFLPPRKRLSILLSGKLKVTYCNRLLHFIHPFHFIDSPEWYMQSTFPDQAKASVPQVSITAVEPCSVLHLNGDHLRQVFDTNPDLAFILDCLIGKDVSEKLYAVAEESASLKGRLGSLPGGGAAGSAAGLISGSTTSSSPFGPWQNELSRSQSADAVHTCNQGQVRSIQWRRDETRRKWCHRYEKLIPSHHRLMSSLLRRDSTPASRPLLAVDGDQTAPTTGRRRHHKKMQQMALLSPPQSRHGDSRHRIRHQQQQQQQPRSSFRRAQHQWNNQTVQFETFV